MCNVCHFDYIFHVDLMFILFCIFVLMYILLSWFFMFILTLNPCFNRYIFCIKRDVLFLCFVRNDRIDKLFQGAEYTCKNYFSLPISVWQPNYASLGYGDVLPSILAFRYLFPLAEFTLSQVNCFIIELLICTMSPVVWHVFFSMAENMYQRQLHAAIDISRDISLVKLIGKSHHGWPKIRYSR